MKEKVIYVDNPFDIKCFFWMKIIGLALLWLVGVAALIYLCMALWMFSPLALIVFLVAFK